MAPETGSAGHWDAAYANGQDTQSWTEKYPAMSLRMLDVAGLTVTDSLVDVGGGASRLADALLDRGHQDLTVLDISSSGIDQARARLGLRSDQVQWLITDLMRWEPGRHYRAWHDRAVFHFLTSTDDRGRYRAILDAATTPDAIAVLGCFAQDGPQQCSGLPVARYSPAELADEQGPRWQLVGSDREVHPTPGGKSQPFTWVALRKQGRYGLADASSLADGLCS
jgi:hypothetical protein